MSGAPLPPAKAPTGAGRVGVLGPVLAVLLLALAVGCGREALVASGRVSGSSWLSPVLRGVDGATPSAAVVVGGVVAVLLGLWVLATGFARRSRRTVQVQGAPQTTLTTRDVARLAAGAAQQQDGVLSAATQAGRRSVDVRVEATTAAVRPAVERAVRGALDGLDPAPRVRVRVQAPASASASAPAVPDAARTTGHLTTHETKHETNGTKEVAS